MQKAKIERLILMDGDGQHNPSEIKKFNVMLNKGYDVVLGSRFINQNNVPKIRRIILFGGKLIERLVIESN